MRRGRPTRETKSLPRRPGPSTLFACPADRPGQGYRSATSPLSRQARRRERRPPDWTDTSLPIFCSRLVVTCTLQDTPLPGSKALTFSTAAPLPRLRQVGYPAFRSAPTRPRRLAIAGVTSPEWPTSWCPIDQPKPNHHPTRDARCPEHRPRQPCRPDGSWVIRPLGAPCHRPSPPPASWRRPGGQDPLSQTLPRACFHEPRAPSANESPLSLPGSHPGTSKGRHQCLGLAAERLASDTPSRLHPKRR